jgi:hypothetical protein
MAKRFKLNQQDPLSWYNSKNRAMDKATHIQELLIIPEGERLQQLDKEMAGILGRKNVSMEEKVRHFEEKLAEFRQVQNKIIKRGGISLLDSAGGDDSDIDVNSPQYMAILKSIVQDIVKQYMKESQQVSPIADGKTKPSLSATEVEKNRTLWSTPSMMYSNLLGQTDNTSRIKTTSTPASNRSFYGPASISHQFDETPIAAHGALVADDDDDDGEDMQQDERKTSLHQPASTSHHMHHNKTKSLSGVKMNKLEDDMEMLNDMLKSEGGVVWKNGNIDFPSDQSYAASAGGVAAKKKPKKHKSGVYKQSTYDKAVEYLLAEKITTILSKITRLVPIMFKNIKRNMKNDMLKDWMTKYPNFKKMVTSADVINFDDWDSSV